ncbi:response regulator transcription factor [Ruicaihuangia caeni]|uniref:response regulator transcription factor n=1 Tax=Ruicaihuangia caeni TaxID=3042517 RepID=UPI00338DDC3D
MTPGGQVGRITTVFVVDDHEIVRRGLCDLLDGESELTVVGEAATARQAVSRIAATLPDVAVIDVRLPDGSGIEVCHEVRSSHPTVHCIVLTAFDDPDANRAAAIAGASAYLVKDIRGRSLIETIRRVASGRSLIDPAPARDPSPQPSVEDPEALLSALTLRELQVLELITLGLTNRQIGERLELAEKTVKNYVSALFTKLGMERRTQAAVYGAKLRRR